MGFEPLSSDGNICIDECVDVIVVEEKVKANKRTLRIATWNFAGLCLVSVSRRR